MASWLGKDTELIQGAADQAFKPSGVGAPAPLGADPTQDCLNTCNDRYQKDLDNPSVDYMEAQRRYTECKESCRDVGAIPTKVAGAPPTAAALPPGMAMGTMAGTQMPPDGEPEPVPPPGPGPEPPFCEGGYKLHTGPITDEDTHPGRGCKEGFKPQYDPATISTWCCPKAAPECTEDRHCPEGYRCVDGRCVPIEEPVIDEDEDGEGCEGGYILSSDPIAGGGGSIWTDDIIKAEHGWFRDPTTEGHRVWHKDWGFQMSEDVYKYLQGTGTLTKSTSGACKKGFKQESIAGEVWCCPTDVPTDTPGLGEYAIPDWLKEFLDMLTGRGKELLDPSQYGYSKEAMEAMFGRGFEKVRGAEAATRESLQDVLSRSGMLGTAAETSKMAETGWETERGIADLQRDLMIKGEEQRKKDLLSYTGLAQSIFGTGIGTEGFLEMINAARRGERKDWYQMLLDFFQGLKY